MAKRALPSDADADLLREIRERYDYAKAEWGDIRKEGATDMLCVSGKVWDALDPAGAEARTKAKRPMITADELNQYYNQVINGIRANPRAIKYTQNGRGATDETAEFYSDKTREIEYRSKAPRIGYIAAAENAIHRSYGFCRVKTKLAGGQQDLWIEALPNPDLVWPDPNALMPDSSDMQFCFVAESWGKEEFTRRWSNAKFTSFNADAMQIAPSWIKSQTVLVAEYWKVKPDGSVCQYLTNGLEILETNEWPGAYIPIISCYGKILYVDGKRVILSMTRLARDPYMLYCYYRTTQAELVGMTPKTPYIGYAGTLDQTQLDEIKRSLHEPVAIILQSPTTEATGQAVLPLLTRQPYRPEIELLEIGAEGARRAIQAAMATNFLPTQAQRRNEKSGVALEKMDQSASRGSYHFNDSYEGMIQHVGVILEDLIEKIYDTARTVGVRKPNDDAEMVAINDPTNPDAVSTVGDHLVTVATGPSHESTQEAAQEFAETLISSPQMAQVIGPQKYAQLLALSIKMKNLGALGDAMADVIDPKDQEQMTPQQMQQLAQENQALKQGLQKAAQAIETDEVKRKTELEKAQIAADKDVKIQIMRDATSIAVAKIAASAKGGIVDQEAENEAIALGEQHAQALQQMGLEHAHEMAMAQQAHEQALEQAKTQAVHGMVAADQQHGNTLAQQQQAAELAPQPEAGA